MKKYIAFEIDIPDNVIADQTGQAELDYIVGLMQLWRFRKNDQGEGFRYFYNFPSGKIGSDLLYNIITGKWEFTDMVDDTVYFKQ